MYVWLMLEKITVDIMHKNIVLIHSLIQTNFAQSDQNLFPIYDHVELGLIEVVSLLLYLNDRLMAIGGLNDVLIVYNNYQVRISANDGVKKQMNTVHNQYELFRLKIFYYQIKMLQKMHQLYLAFRPRGPFAMNRLNTYKEGDVKQRKLSYFPMVMH